MEIIFTSKKLQRTCTNEKQMIKAHGSECAKKLQQRLYELLAAPDMSCIPPHARCHPLSGKRQYQYAVDLVHPFRLVFEPYCDDLPLNANGSLDVAKVTTIVILEVKDYH